MELRVAATTITPVCDMPHLAFAKFGERLAGKPYIVRGGLAYNLDTLTADVDAGFLASGGIGQARAALEAGQLREIGPVAELGRRGAPVAGVGKVVYVGLNYRDHVKETGAGIPAEPVLFLEDSSSIVGPEDVVLIPRGSTKTDWEVVLAVLIGAIDRYLEDAEQALTCVAGYTIAHDVSERGFQLKRGGQWDKARSCETFNPLGPWLAPATEVQDPQALGLRLWVSGALRQNGNTKEMLFGVAELVPYISQFMVLRPGDVVNTGTLAGVALGQSEPKPCLRAGDRVQVEIDGFAQQRQYFEQA
jgi:2-keto-4-pentenoate hydratase/2-oxohepta-3-ene-1,7-dioic acid hydratase in catechol pathway